MALGLGSGLGFVPFLGWGVGVLFPIALTLKNCLLALLLGAPRGWGFLAWPCGGLEGGVAVAAPTGSAVRAAVPLLPHPHPLCTLQVQPPECLFASQRTNPLNRESATLGSFPNMGPSSVTPIK